MPSTPLGPAAAAGAASDNNRTTMNNMQLNFFMIFLHQVIARQIAIALSCPTQPGLQTALALYDAAQQCWVAHRRWVPPGEKSHRRPATFAVCQNASALP